MKSLPMFAQVCMLPLTPESSRKAKNRLAALDYLDRQLNPNYDRGQFILPNYSKRRKRLAKMYWAFKKKEAKA